MRFLSGGVEVGSVDRCWLQEVVIGETGRKPHHSLVAVVVAADPPLEDRAETFRRDAAVDARRLVVERLDDAAEEEIFIGFDETGVEASEMPMPVVNGEVGEAELRLLIDAAVFFGSECETIVRQRDELFNLVENKGNGEC